MIAELEARASKASRKHVEVGASKPIKFSFKDEGDEETITTIDLPEESFVHILHFLDGHELLDSSLVSKVWLSATRLPVVWADGLDMSRLNLNKTLNMTSLLKLLREPQFANLKALALPHKVKLGASSTKQLARALPYLETFDVGYYSGQTKAKDKDLMDAVEQFPNLSGLRTDMWNVTSWGISTVARDMGNRLLDLRIKAETITNNYVSGHTLETIASSCPNLKYFAYKSSADSLYYNSSLDGVRGENVLALVKACPKLETLELQNVYVHFKQSHYIEIAEYVASNLETHALRNLFVYGHSGVHPSGRANDKVLDPFDINELLAEYTFLNVVNKFCHPRLGTGVMFWDLKYETDGIPKRTRNLV